MWIVDGIITVRKGKGRRIRGIEVPNIGKGCAEPADMQLAGEK
jgi:hypothetical protein